MRCEIAWLVSPLGRISLTVVWISRDEIVSSPGRMSLMEVWIREMDGNLRVSSSEFYRTEKNTLEDQKLIVDV